MKKDIEQRRWRSLRSKNSDPGKEEYFVDKTRNLGVVAWEKDIKQDMKKKISHLRKSLTYKDIEKDYKTLCQRGLQLLKKGELGSALQLLDKEPLNNATLHYYTLLHITFWFYICSCLIPRVMLKKFITSIIKS